MTCREVKRLLIDEKRMNDPEVLDHVRECPNCEQLRAEFLSLEELNRLLRDRVQAPSDFASRVSEARRRMSGWRVCCRPVFALAVLVLVLVSLIVVWAAGLKLEFSSPEKAWVSSAVLPGTESLPEVRMGAEWGSPAQQAYVDVVVGDPSGPGYVLRLPSRIEIRRTKLHTESDLKNVGY